MECDVMNSTMDTPVQFKQFSKDEQAICKDIDFSKQSDAITKNHRRGKRTIRDREE